MIGYVDHIEREQAGSALVAALAVGDTTVTVDWAVDFTNSGGLAQVAGTTLEYVMADEDEATGFGILTLAAPSPIAAALSEDLFVLALNAAGEAETDWTVWVKFDPDDEEAEEGVACDVSSNLARMMREGDIDAGLAVEVETVPGGYQITSFVGRSGSLDGDAVWNPHVIRSMTAATIPHDTWTTLTGWTDVEVDGLGAVGGVVTVITSGLYVLTTDPAFMANATGRRRVAFLRNDDTVGFAGGTAEPEGASQVTLSKTLRVYEGDTIKVQLNQTSGAGLAISLSASRSSFSMYRVSI